MSIDNNNVYYLGCDFGSSAIKMLIMDQDNRIVEYVYEKNIGIFDTTIKVLAKLKKFKISGVGVTGSGRHFGSGLLGADLMATEIVAHAKAAVYYFPETATLFEIGGEDCKLILIKDRIVDKFVMNTLCGSGTGSLIEAIAGRLGISVEEFGETALQSRNRVNIAGKCGIFAQSSIVSKLNQGYHISDIAMGVARALVDNYFAMLVKGKRLKERFVFQGATAFNKALVKAFSEKLKTEVIVPDNPHLMGAIGIILLTKEKLKKETIFRGWEKITFENLSLSSLNLTGCANSCEVTKIINKDGLPPLYFGNRCDRCLGD